MFHFGATSLLSTSTGLIGIGAWVAAVGVASEPVYVPSLCHGLYRNTLERSRNPLKSGQIGGIGGFKLEQAENSQETLLLLVFSNILLFRRPKYRGFESLRLRHLSVLRCSPAFAILELFN